MLGALVALLAAAAGPCVHDYLVEHDRNLFFGSSGGEKRVTDFGPQDRILRYDLADDGVHLLVSWRHGRGVLQLDLYDLSSAERTARFAPGFGGALGWTPGNHAVLLYGCGAGCADVDVFDLAGRRVWNKLAALGEASGVEVSPRWDVAAVFSTLSPPAKLRVVSLETGEVIWTSPRRYTNVIDVQFKPGGKLLVVEGHEDGTDRRSVVEYRPGAADPPARSEKCRSVVRR